MLSVIVAKYKQKKKVKSQDGGETTVYVYSERQIALRHKEKAERLEKLRKSKSELDTQVKKDLNSKDAKIQGIALAIALMDATAERVGNETSADEGHVGVTGWSKEHISFKNGKAHIKYVGKSGVSQEKTISEKYLVDALKKACEKSDGDCVVGVSAEDVNSYLKDFDITAKDIRGLHANEAMKENLRAVRKKGPKLPEDKKDREKLLKEEWKEALELTAEAVGHESKTLAAQYLVPSMQDDFMDDGGVNESLDKKGTKTPAEREDRAYEKKLRPQPKKKPPRRDLRKPPRTEEPDPDFQGLNSGDGGDRDLSLNYKKVADRFSRYMASRISASVQRSAGSRSPTTMPKLSQVGVKKLTADLDRVASVFQHHAPKLGLPPRIASDFAWACDYMSDHLERKAGLRSPRAKRADFDPAQNFTESEDIPNRFDAAEIGMEQDGPLMQDPDEPYMDCFNQDEFDQLREVQQTGQFSNAKVAARMVRKLATLLYSKGIKLKVAQDEAKEEEETEEEETPKKASDPYQLFG